MRAMHAPPIINPARLFSIIVRQDERAASLLPSPLLLPDKNTHSVTAGLPPRRPRA